LLTDLFNHIPRDALVKNFGLSEAAFANVPTDYEHDRYIFNGQVPGPKSGDSVHSTAGLVLHAFSHRLMEQERECY
jgi:oxalate decarboxylase